MEPVSLFRLLILKKAPPSSSKGLACFRRQAHFPSSGSAEAVSNTTMKPDAAEEALKPVETVNVAV
jgi:hypothetical protein